MNRPITNPAAPQIFFRYKDGMYELVRSYSYPEGKSSEDVLSRAKEVAILYDASEGVVFKFGSLDDVVSGAKKMVDKLRLSSTGDILLKDLKIVKGSGFNVDDLNRIIGTSGYIKTFLTQKRAGVSFYKMNFSCSKDDQKHSTLGTFTYSSVAEEIVKVLCYHCSFTETVILSEIQEFGFPIPGERVHGVIPFDLLRWKFVANAAERWARVKIAEISNRTSPGEVLENVITMTHLMRCLDCLFWIRVRLMFDKNGFSHPAIVAGVRYDGKNALFVTKQMMDQSSASPDAFQDPFSSLN